MKNLYLLIILTFSQFSFSQGLPAREETSLDDVYNTYGLTGENVLIIMIERGIDYRHPDFIDENGNTRIAYIYDMTDPTGANDPENPYGVGTIFTSAQINDALDTNLDPPLTTDRHGHGTATTGITCGDGSGTANLEFQGVAPKATIISIKITLDSFPPFNGEPGQSGFWDPTYVPIALAFAQDKIDELGLPSVTLMNLGSIGGPTDGTSTNCQAIDNFITAGNVFLCGVGDDGGEDNFASGNINQNQTIEIDINKGETGNLRFDLWYSEDDRFTVSIERPNGIIEGPFSAPNNVNGVEDQNLGDIYIGHRGANVEFWGATSNRRELLIDFSGVTGIYKVILEGTQINDGGFKATLNAATYYNSNKFLSYVTPGYSINDFASANLVITPTDYVVQNDWVDIDGVFRDITGQGEYGEIWIGSSSSPTQDGRLGVDFAAPGEVCYAAYSPNTYYEQFQFNVLQNSNGLYGIQNAVSAAAPLSMGIIALMLEANPSLTPEQVETILQQSSISDSDTGSVPNDTWGYGKLNALLAIENTLGIEESNFITASISPNPTNGELIINLGESYPETTIEVYTVLGQKVQEYNYQNRSEIKLTIEGQSGIYFIKITNLKEKSVTLKAIKK